MPKNNRPGVQAVQELDPADLEDLEDENTEAETEGDGVTLLQADDDETDDDDFGEDWKPPSQLEAPPARPGYAQRWCRMSAQGRADAAQRLYNDQQGWRPRRIESVSEADRAKYPTGTDAGYGAGIITQGALILCEMPIRKVKQRNAYYGRKNERQMEAMVTNPIAETNQAARAGFGPIKMSRTSKTTTGRKSIAQAD